VHVVPFTADSVSVVDPGTHTSHADVDKLLYCPATHDVQFVPPIEASVFVNEPAAHAMQAVWPSLPWY
jgi:hypothetical protein